MAIDVGLPDKLSITQDGGDLRIERIWFGSRILFLTVFAVIWDGVLFVAHQGATDTATRLFLLIHVGAGICITYVVIANWLNRTRISVDYQTVAVRHYPIPWIGNKQVPVQDIKQLYADEHVRHRKNGVDRTYRVKLITRSGRTVILVRGLETRDQALYIEQEIEKYLQIKDERVKGELLK